MLVLKARVGEGSRVSGTEEVQRREVYGAEGLGTGQPIAGRVKVGACHRCSHAQQRASEDVVPEVIRDADDLVDLSCFDAEACGAARLLQVGSKKFLCIRLEGQ